MVPAERSRHVVGLESALVAELDRRGALGDADRGTRPKV